MKKILSVLLVLMLLVAVTPAAAANNVRIGERINVITQTPDQFTAGAPFHIEHGWTFTLSQDPMKGLGLYHFELDVDGVRVDEDFSETWVETVDTKLIHLSWVYNYPEGMTGVHTFTGHWLGPCKVLVDTGLYPGPCANPMQIVEAVTHTLQVTFIP